MTKVTGSTVKALLGSAAIAAVMTVVALLALGQSARATQIDAVDPFVDVVDPFFDESQGLANTCFSGCLSVTMGLDPLSSMNTVMYTFRSTSIPRVVEGDVKVTEFGSAVVGDVLRFENISGTARMFLFSNDVSGGFPADVGLPASFQSNLATLAEGVTGSTGFSYFPTSAQPGFCLTLAGAPCGSAAGYGLQSADIPEPASMALLSFGLFGLGLIKRRRLMRGSLGLSPETLP